MAVSESLGDFENDDSTCENGIKGCPNAPGVSETVDGDIEKIECLHCYTDTEAFHAQ